MRGTSWRRILDGLEAFYGNWEVYWVFLDSLLYTSLGRTGKRRNDRSMYYTGG